MPMGSVLSEFLKVFWDIAPEVNQLVHCIIMVADLTAVTVGFYLLRIKLHQ